MSDEEKKLEEAAKAAEKKAADAEKQIKAAEKAEEKMLAKACDDYGIDPGFVFSNRVDVEKQQVVIVTAGGKKVTWEKGQALDAIDIVGITGVNPKNDARKPLVGKKAK